MVEIETPEGSPNIGRALEMYFGDEILDDYNCPRYLLLVYLSRILVSYTCTHEYFYE